MQDRANISESAGDGAGAAPVVDSRRAQRRAAHAALIAAIALLGSMAVHGAVLAIGAVLAWTIAGQGSRRTHDVTISFLDPGPQPAPAPRPPAPDRPDSNVPRVAERPSDAPTVSPRADATQGAPSLDLGPAANPDVGWGEGGLDLAVATPRTDAEPVRFAGLGASTARSVVYAVDASGPMVSSLPLVIDEVIRSVSRLEPTQKFSVVLFHKTDAVGVGGGGGVGGGDPSDCEVFAPTLIRATPTAKRRLTEFLAGVKPRGRSNPLAGLESALALRPDAIFLLSRSIERSGGGVWELGAERTLSRLDELNPVDASTGRRPTLIRTIQFIDDDTSGIMRRIGESHGGGGGDDTYLVIRSGEDLARDPATP